MNSPPRSVKRRLRSRATRRPDDPDARPVATPLPVEDATLLAANSGHKKRHERLIRDRGATVAAASPDKGTSQPSRIPPPCAGSKVVRWPADRDPAAVWWARGWHLFVVGATAVRWSAASPGGAGRTTIQCSGDGRSTGAADTATEHAECGAGHDTKRTSAQRPGFGTAGCCGRASNATAGAHRPRPAWREGYRAGAAAETGGRCERGGGFYTAANGHDSVRSSARTVKCSGRGDRGSGIATAATGAGRHP